MLIMQSKRSNYKKMALSLYLHYKDDKDYSQKAISKTRI